MFSCFGNEFKENLSKSLFTLKPKEGPVGISPTPTSDSDGENAHGSVWAQRHF